MTLTPPIHPIPSPAQPTPAALRTAAFTLIELLLAITVVAVIFTAINAIFFGALRLRNKTNDMVEQAFTVDQLVATLRADLSHMLPPGALGTNLAGPLKTDSIQTPGVTPDQSLEFYTNTGTLDPWNPWSDIQRVVYTLRDPDPRFSPPSTRGKDLVRLVSRNLLAPSQQLPTEQFLIDQVERFQFEFYDGSQWKSAWDSTTADFPLPTAVRIQILRSAPDAASLPNPSLRPEPPPPIQLFVPILVQAPTNQTQTATTGGAP